MLTEPYDCARDCQRSDGTWDDERRSARGCGLPGLPVVEAQPTAQGLYQSCTSDPYIGRYPDRAIAGETYLGIPVAWSRPLEHPDRGCPAAWYRTAFIDSLYPYCRRRIEGGGRVPNPRFDQADWQIQEMVQEYEREQERSVADIENIQADRARARAEAQTKGRRSRGRR